MTATTSKTATVGRRELNAAKLDAYHHSLAPYKVLSEKEWSALINGWNKIARPSKPSTEITAQREARLTLCRTLGHDWAMTPIDIPMCKRCCRYDNEG